MSARMLLQANCRNEGSHITMISPATRRIDSAAAYVSAQHRWRQLCAGIFCLLLASCALPPVASGPSADDVTRQQRAERAQANLNEGLKRYEAGSYEEAMKNFLFALDSGVLPVPQQLVARKHMAFMHCLGGREPSCKEEFQKAFTLDARFDLTPAEAGHPSWGPVFRVVKAETEMRKSRFPMLPAFLGPSLGDKLISDGMVSYEATDYNKAIKSFQDALKETLPDSEQIKAHKFIAFSYCLSNRAALCRSAFEKILQLKPDFDLEPAEAGHPSWGPSFRAVKSKQKTTPAKK